MSQMPATGAAQHAINPDKPFDAVITNLVAQAAGRGRGFALGVAQDVQEGGKNVTFTVEQQLPPADEWEPPAPYRAHALEDAYSLVNYAQKYGTQEKSLVFYNDAGIELVLNDQTDRGLREIITVAFRYSAEWNAWAGVLDGRTCLEHRQLLAFLLLQQHTLMDPAVIDAMRQVRATYQANYESDLRFDAESVGVAFKATAGDELVKFPRSFRLSLPVLDQDVDDALLWKDVPVRLEVIMPDGPQKPVRFQLLAPTLNAVRRHRTTMESEAIKEALKGWVIVRGKHKEVDRDLGREE